MLLGEVKLFGFVSCTISGSLVHLFGTNPDLIVLVIVSVELHGSHTALGCFIFDLGSHVATILCCTHGLLQVLFRLGTVQVLWRNMRRNAAVFSDAIFEFLWLLLVATVLAVDSLSLSLSINISFFGHEDVFLCANRLVLIALADLFRGLGLPTLLSTSQLGFL